MPRVIEVIESEITRGEGIPGDPIRRVVQYHAKDGELLAEHDPFFVISYGEKIRFNVPDPPKDGE